MNLIWYLQAGIGTGWGREGARICMEYFTNIDDPFFRLNTYVLKCPYRIQQVPDNLRRQITTNWSYGSLGDRNTAWIGQFPFAPSLPRWHSAARRASWHGQQGLEMSSSPATW